jgi:hypothetical protein
VKALSWLASCAFVLSVFPSLAVADDSLGDWVKRRVQEGIVGPLSQTEGKSRSFSRGRPPPRERRVRVLQTELVPDKSGQKFMAFAIDVRFGGGDWQTDDVVGCVYGGSGKLFVKIGDSYRPAAFLLGKDSEPVPGVCESVPPAQS